MNHYGSDVWQRATWSFSYTGTGNFWDVDLAFTNLDTSATISNTFNVELAGLTASDVFTEVTPRGQSTGSMYVDNIQVSTVPEPSTGLLLTLGLTALSFRRRHVSPPAPATAAKPLARTRPGVGYPLWISQIAEQPAADSVRPVEVRAALPLVLT